MKFQEGRYLLDFYLRAFLEDGLYVYNSLTPNVAMRTAHKKGALLKDKATGVVWDVRPDVKDNNYIIVKKAIIP